MTHPAQTQALHAAARDALAGTDVPNLARIARELIALAEELGDPRELGYGYSYLGMAHFWRNDARQAEEAYNKGLALLRDVNDPEGVARITLGLAKMAMHGEQALSKARQLYEEALPIVRGLADKKLLAVTLGSLGELCQFDADYAPALNYAAEAIALFDALGMQGPVGVQYVNIAHVHTLRRDFAAALAYLRRAFALLRDVPNPRRLAWFLDMCFVFASRLEQWEAAARLLGLANRYRDERNVERLELTPWFTAHIERMSNHFDARRLQELQIEGEALSEDAVLGIVESIAPGGAN